MTTFRVYGISQFRCVLYSVGKSDSSWFFKESKLRVWSPHQTPILLELVNTTPRRTKLHTLLRVFLYLFSLFSLLFLISSLLFLFTSCQAGLNLPTLKPAFKSGPSGETAPELSSHDLNKSRNNTGQNILQSDVYTCTQKHMFMYGIMRME